MFNIMAVVYAQDNIERSLLTLHTSQALYFSRIVIVIFS